MNIYTARVHHAYPEQLDNDEVILKYTKQDIAISIGLLLLDNNLISFTKSDFTIEFGNKIMTGIIDVVVPNRRKNNQPIVTTD